METWNKTRRENNPTLDSCQICWCTTRLSPWMEISCWWTELSRVVRMLAKIRYVIDTKTLIMIYYGIFSSLMLYGSQICYGISISAMEKLQNRALRILNLEHYLSSTTVQKIRNPKMCRQHYAVKFYFFPFMPSKQYSICPSKQH